MTGSLLPEIAASSNNAPPVAEDVEFDQERMLPLAVIRQHAKIDDVPQVTDDLLSLYRKAAFEAAEQYTGRVFTRLKTITEIVKRDNRTYRRARVHFLRHPSADGIVYVYGSSFVGTHILHVDPGTDKLSIPVRYCMADLSSCCDPCGGGDNVAMRLMYRTGLVACTEVPSGILLGVLKFVAFSANNPGDEILTVRNRIDTSATGIIGTNNVAMASGALELWRQYAVGYNGI